MSRASLGPQVPAIAQQMARSLAAMSRASLVTIRSTVMPYAGMDGHDAGRASSAGAEVCGAASGGSGGPAQAAGGAVRGGAAGARCGGGRAVGDGAIRAHRRLRARGVAAEPGARHGGGHGVDDGGDRGADRTLPPGRPVTLDAGGGMAARAPGARGPVARGDGASAVPHQELGVTPAGAAQGARARDACQGGGGADPAAGGDEVPAAVGPGQRRARTQVDLGAGGAPGFGATDGAALRRLARSGRGGTRADRLFAAGVHADGRRGPAPHAAPATRGRAADPRSGRPRGRLRASCSPRAQRNCRRRVGMGAQADLDGVGGGGRAIRGAGPRVGREAVGS